MDGGDYELGSRSGTRRGPYGLLGSPPMPMITPPMRLYQPKRKGSGSQSGEAPVKRGRWEVATPGSASGVSLISGTYAGAHVNGGTFTLSGRDTITTVHHHHSPAPLGVLEIFHSSSLPNFRNIQIDTFAKATIGTCIWFTEGCPFLLWIKKGKILWGVGIPGAGKTILVSIAINYLEKVEETSGGSFCLAFIYFRYSEPLSIQDILESLVQQIVERHSDFIALVENLYAKHKHERTTPSQYDLVRLLSELVKNGKTIFVVLDALDELAVQDRPILLELLASVEVKLFITSRPLETLQQNFSQAQFVKIEAHPSDIDLHIKESLRRNPDLKELVEGCEFENWIIETIHEKYGGMFLHANLQLQALGRSFSIQDAEETLSQFPVEIGGAYLKTWERILGQGPKHANLAKLVFLWILHANGEMDITVLRHAIATCPDRHTFQAKRLIPEALLISVCCGLVSVDEKTRVIRLIHYTAKEIILPLVLESFPHPHTIPAQVCIAHLTVCGFQNVTFTSDKDLDEVLNEDPLLKYAHNSWDHHARQSRESAIVATALTDFVLGCTKYPGWVYGFVMDLMSPLHVAAMHGFEQLIQPAAQMQSPNALTTYYEVSPLMLACERGEEPCVVLLLALPSINVNLVDFSQSTAFMIASEQGHVAILRHLLKVPDLNINARHVDGWDALLWAVCFGRTDAVRLLLKVPGVDADGIDDDRPLVNAAHRGHTDIVKLLLDVPYIDINKTNRGGGTALHCAAISGRIEIARLLLQVSNINVNAMSESADATALMYASRAGHTEVVNLLLAFPGIVVDAVDRDGRTALSSAFQNGHQEVVVLILDFWISRCTRED
ncbi:ankyrin repeat-containing domain protein [Coprinopsis sp. MPI-PUGE-AT-0042]|nr:ankyrin repeat-containing domain protein [Coprinopsis sp. MPI-PUGE-AT-0042]